MSLFLRQQFLWNVITTDVRRSRSQPLSLIFELLHLIVMVLFAGVGSQRLESIGERSSHICHDMPLRRFGLPPDVLPRNNEYRNQPNYYPLHRLPSWSKGSALCVRLRHTHP